ncbi:MAG: class I SAM-dependent rRNA methyltransferase, partial [Bacteroidota bacterium]|nr:class I SAM-dependent rRNA methyltransferase [Bacteroidota bacterium]
MPSYPRLILNPKAEKAVFNRHPWLFSGAIAKAPEAADGDIVEVTNGAGRVYGYGFFSPMSQIRCRMFHWGEAEDFDGLGYWSEKLKNAISVRKRMVISEETNTYRLVHAEGDLFPGLIIDIYNNVAVGQVLIKGMEQRIAFIADALKDAGFNHFYLKAKTSSRELEDVRSASGWFCGGAASPVEVLENGLKFLVDIESGQKTGFFIDQRENRRLLKTFSKDKTVLNTFSYTGGFSAYAIAGGAAHVDSVDISADALKMCDNNIALNFIDAPHRSIVADCFEFLREMPADKYDIIVLDPPAFAKNQRSVPNATRGYKQINLQAFRKIKSGGVVFTYS